jgi:threonine synthase
VTGYRCPACDARPAFTASRWRCDCGAPLDLEGDATAYRIAGEATAERPLVADRIGRDPVRWVLEFASPTGSYKDRGAAALVLAAAALGVRRVVDDTSGNAGLALAAAGAHAGLAVTLCVPEDARPEKPRLAGALGAEIVTVPGTRDDAAAAAQRLARDGTFYASHAWSPFFLHGTASLAHELASRLDPDELGAVVVPCGNGGLVLGLELGFSALYRAGRLARVPAIIAVQAAGCAPLARGYAAGGDAPADGTWAGTIADGIRVARPPRGAQTLRAVRRTGGAVLEVAEREIVEAWRWLWSRGLPVEATSAVVAALLRRDVGVLAERHGGLVAVLTGSGLKGPTP